MASHGYTPFWIASLDKFLRCLAVIALHSIVRSSVTGGMMKTFRRLMAFGI